MQIHVLTGGEVELPIDVQDQPVDVGGQRFAGRDGRLAVADRVLEPVVVEDVEQLDRQVAVRHRPAQQRVARLLLRIGQREGRVALQRYLPLEHEALARRALPLPAAVDEREALTESCVENGLVIAAFDLLVDWLEKDSWHGNKDRGDEGVRATPHRGAAIPRSGDVGASLETYCRCAHRREIS